MTHDEIKDCDCDQKLVRRETIRAKSAFNNDASIQQKGEKVSDDEAEFVYEWTKPPQVHPTEREILVWWINFLEAFLTEVIQFEKEKRKIEFNKRKARNQRNYRMRKKARLLDKKQCSY